MDDEAVLCKQPSEREPHAYIHVENSPDREASIQRGVLGGGPTEKTLFCSAPANVNLKEYSPCKPSISTSVA